MKRLGPVPAITTAERVVVTTPEGDQYAIEVVEEGGKHVVRVSSLDGTPISSHHPAAYPFQSVLLVGPRS